MNKIEMIHSLASAVLLGELQERGRGNALRHFTKTAEILMSGTGLRDGIKTDYGKSIL